MDATQIKYFLGKSVRIILKNGFHYTGKVEFLGETSIRICDKFGQPVIISISDISLIEGNGGQR